MADVKYAYRLPPCPDYDIACVESWLEDLAKEGLLLVKDTPFFGFYSFIRTAPQTVKFRLEPAVKAQGFWDGDPGTPKEEAQDLYAELGWEYVTRYGEFFIYRSSNPHARELHTDPEIQAMALTAIKKRQWHTLAAEILLVVFYACFGILRYPMGITIAMGGLAALAFYIYFLIMVIRPAFVLWKLHKLRRQIVQGDAIYSKRDWKPHALVRQILQHAPDALFAVVLLFSIFARISDEMQEIKLEDFSGNPPFVTIADLNPGGEYDRKSLSYANRMRQWESWPFVDNWEWYEFASIELPNGTTVSGPLDVKYSEALSPILAEQFAKELILYADTGKYFTEAVPLDTEFPDVKVYRYQGKYGLDTVLLICDNIVVEAQILVDNAEGGSARDLWIQLMAERLIRK